MNVTEHFLPTLYLRADADERAGAGHVMRSVALGSAWSKSGGKAVLLTVRLGTVLQKFAAAHAVEVRHLSGVRHPGDQGDIESTIRALRTEETGAQMPPWLALDGYRFASDFQCALREAGQPLLVIDDTAQLERYYADVLLNQNLGAPKLGYNVQPATLKLFGPRFALLRPEFGGESSRVEHAAVVRRILVTCGGADAENVTIELLRALEKAGLDDVEVVVAVGALNSHVSHLQRYISESALARAVRVVVNPPSMAELMSWADLAIASAGVTAWELCSMGVPSLLVVAAPNQAIVATELERAGAAINLGASDTLSEADVVQAVRAAAHDVGLRTELSTKARQLVDGRGAGHVVDVLRAYTRLKHVLQQCELRPVDQGDEQDVLTLANDAEVRCQSLSPDPIRPEDHAVWFSRALLDPATAFWILRDHNRVVAQVRYSRIAGDVAEVHFAVAPGYRGKGVGTILLQGTTWPTAVQLGVRRISAMVLHDNVASARAFVKAGYSQTGCAQIKGKDCLLYELDGLGLAGAE